MGNFENPVPDTLSVVQDWMKKTEIYDVLAEVEKAFPGVDCEVSMPE